MTEGHEGPAERAPESGEGVLWAIRVVDGWIYSTLVVGRIQFIRWVKILIFLALLEVKG